MSKQIIEELSEDIEVVSPGQMLRDAREKKGLSALDVANLLNLRLAVINDIEDNEFDPKLVTFTRGYLKAYAKLVDLPEKELLDALRHFDTAQQQAIELQSFSKRTNKQSSDKRLMALTYLIFAILAALMVLWWTQQEDADVISPVTEPSSMSEGESQPVFKQQIDNQDLQQRQPTSDEEAAADSATEPEADTNTP